MIPPSDIGSRNRGNSTQIINNNTAVSSLRVSGDQQKNLSGSILSVRNSDEKSHVYFKDKFTLAAQRLFTVIGQTVLSIVRLLPGIDAAVAASDSHKQIDTVKQLGDELKQRRADICEQLKKEGYDDDTIEKIKPVFDKSLAALQSTGASQQLLDKIQQYKQSHMRLPAAKTERNASLVNAISVAIGTVRTAVLGVAKTIPLGVHGTSAAAQVASTALTAAAGVILIPVQVAAIGRDVTHVIAARQRNQPLKANQTTLEAFEKINKQQQQSVESRDIQHAQAVMEKKISYNNKLMVGNSISAVGNSVSLAGSITSLSGVGAVVGIPLAIIGFTASTAGSIRNAISQGQDDTFSGKAASESARQKIASTTNRANIGGVTKTIQDDARLMNHYQMMVAESKLHSLINQVLKDARKGKISIEPESLRKEVESRGNKLIGRLSRSTSLLDSDLNQMNALLEKDYPLEFFSSDSVESLQKDLNARVRKNMDNLGLQPSTETLNKIHQEMTEKLFLLRHGDDNADIKRALLTDAGKKKKILTADELKQLCDNHPHVQEIYNKVSTQHLVQQLKIDSKFLRHNATEQFINSAHAVVKQENMTAPTSSLKVDDNAQSAHQAPKITT